MPPPWPEGADLDVAEWPPLDRLGHPVRPDPRGWDRWRLPAATANWRASDWLASISSLTASRALISKEWGRIGGARGTFNQRYASHR